MKKQLTVTAALLALGVSSQAQVTSPNRPATTTTPGTFSTPRVPAVPPPINNFDTLPPSLGDLSPIVPNNPPVINNNAPVVNDQFRNQPRPGVIDPDPIPGPRNGVLPNTSIGTPDATTRDNGALRSRTFRGNNNGLRGSINDSANWDHDGIGGPAGADVGTDAGRLTPPPDVSPTPQPLSATGGRNTIVGATATSPNPGQLTTTGVKHPPRVQEQPLDRSLSAKVRAQLSSAPAPGAKPAIALPPEMVRDLRITSQNGRVELEGAVENQQQKDLIELRAKEVQGVAVVDNHLVIRGQNKPVGAPAGAQSGKSTELKPSKPAVNGQTPQNSSDLDDRHPEITPEK